jgi:hypothetical protein
MAVPTGWAMSEPNCRIDWFYEGYRQVWLYDGLDMTGEEWADLCAAVAEAIQDAHAIEALSAAIDATLQPRGVVAQLYPGPSHSDPLRNTVRVGLFRNGHEPRSWQSEP